MIGKTVSHYKIVEKIGEGGMGQVFLADDLELRRRVALKFLPPEYVSDADALSRFKREAQAAAALDHPNIITIYDVGEYQGRPYIVMAYVEGDTLTRVVARKDLTVDRALAIATRICEALASAHAASVVHRDIKPDNIIIGPDGEPKILDFGLAKLRGVTQLTRETSTVGTIGYMSPEQARGDEVDERSDIFSLGAVMYEMITGRPPFTGDHAAAVLYAIANEEPQPMKRYNNAVTDDVERLVAKAMAKDRDARYQTARDLVVDLTAEHAPPPKSTPPASRKRPSRVPWIAAIAVAVLAVAWYFIHPGGNAPSAADRKSIAVLPFENMSADPENEYFSDGITDDIITQLSKIADLRVVSRTSSMRYKNSGKSAREIANELHVATILEGSVRRAEGKVRIVSQLVDARTDEHIWADTYDRDLREIFEVQSDVATRIAHSLQAALTPEESARIQAPPTNDMTAYDYYLRGRETYYRYRREDNENAIAFFKKALKHDPNYGLAYAGLGDAYGQRVMRYGFGAAWIDSSLEASRKAIALDPDRAEGYKALGVGYITKGWITKSLEANIKAVQLDPNYAAAVGNVGWDYLWMGRPDEALPWFRKYHAKQEDDALGFLGVGAVYQEIGDHQTARKWLHAALDVQPDMVVAQMMILAGEILDGQMDEKTARAQVQALAKAHPEEPRVHMLVAWEEIRAGDLAAAAKSLEGAAKKPIPDLLAKESIDAVLGCVLFLLGERERAAPMLERCEKDMSRVIERGNEYSDMRMGLAYIYATRGDKREALDWLERAFEAGELDCDEIEQSPFFRNLRDDARFQRMIADTRARREDMRRHVQEIDSPPP